MANTPDYSWPPKEQRKVIGQRVNRLDGPVKATGRAKYASDTKVSGMLYGAYVACPHAHAKVTSVDTSEAEKMPGVKAVHVMAPAGTEIQWQGWEVAAVAALTELQARDAARKIQVAYEAMPHLVHEEDLSKAGANAKRGSEQKGGDVDQAIQQAEAVSEGHYGFPVITHCCLESHGQVVQWQGENASAWPSTQDVTDYGGQLAQSLKIPATNVKVQMDYVGGGFGSKFSPDAWATVAANLSQKAGGRPVRLFLDRQMEQMIAGNRPSAYAKIRIAGKKDGTITGWDSASWGSGGFQPGGPPPQPYVFVTIPNYRRVHTGVSLNVGPSQAWRAPGNQAASYLTCCAMEDFAAKIGMDPLEVFRKNVNYAQPAFQERYRFQLNKAAELAEWNKLWHPRGQSGAGPVKRGLGVAVGTWGGRGHASNCRTTIHPDGSVLVEIGTQDLGTGTRTIITQVAAESLGLPVSAVKLEIGRSDQPRDGASGGSSTVGGVSTSTRKSAVNALAKLLEAVAPALSAQPEQLQAVDGRIQVKGSPEKSLTWKEACRKLGTASIAEMGSFNGRNDGAGLSSEGAAGVQIADVSVDTETGVVSINRYVAVQDCGLVINPKLSESVVYGAVIMGISTALFEERIMDQQTGHMLNADMEFYKLAGIGDIGDIVVHMDIRPENDSKGVIGLGEPPAIPICAAVGNAVANAIGVRVAQLPMTPEHVLNTLEGRNA
ncbi:MAG: xanthine dehydrogenase family protein molybdopterin-binding subunit [Bryobacteraceae bacterium]|jgi:xanthine dehydrogenase YagR molybdenum-binding subunit